MTKDEMQKFLFAHEKVVIELPWNDFVEVSPEQGMRYAEWLGFEVFRLPERAKAGGEIPVLRSPFGRGPDGADAGGADKILVWKSEAQGEAWVKVFIEDGQVSRFESNIPEITLIEITEGGNEDTRS